MHAHVNEYLFSRELKFLPMIPEPPKNGNLNIKIYTEFV